MRIFIAINFSPEARKELGELTQKLQKSHWPVRWEETSKIHVTLAFLGKLKTKNAKRKTTTKNLKLLIEEAVKEIKSFEVSFKGLGAFPDFFMPRIVWVGLKGDLKSLAALQKGIERELKKAGIWFDKKPFTPHVTIGRVKKGISKGALLDLGKKIKKLRQIDFQSRILVASVDIMRSDLLPGGSVYTMLAEIKLGC